MMNIPIYNEEKDELTFIDPQNRIINRKLKDIYTTHTIDTLHPSWDRDNLKMVEVIQRITNASRYIEKKVLQDMTKPTTYDVIVSITDTIHISSPVEITVEVINDDGEIISTKTVHEKKMGIGMNNDI